MLLLQRRVRKRAASVLATVQQRGREELSGASPLLVAAALGCALLARPYDALDINLTCSCSMSLYLPVWQFVDKIAPRQLEQSEM